MISSASHTGGNEFELGGVPLGQVGSGRDCVVCEGLGGESEDGRGESEGESVGGAVWCVGKLGGESEKGGGDGGIMSIGSSQ